MYLLLISSLSQSVLYLKIKVLSQPLPVWSFEVIFGLYAAVDRVST
jgi:hypothetical protein